MDDIASTADVTDAATGHDPMAPDAVARATDAASSSGAGEATSADALHGDVDVTAAATVDAGTAGAHHGYSAERDAYLKRLRRIEGQIRGLQRMVGEDAYCIDILTQISAATRALQGVALALLDEHIRHCVANAVAGGGPGGDASITEAMEAIERLVKA
jgi:CsoR family transcriptional regulator, copper-sensing transcriptional repressor